MAPQLHSFLDYLTSSFSSSAATSEASTIYLEAPVAVNNRAIGLPSRDHQSSRQHPRQQQQNGQRQQNERANLSQQLRRPSQQCRRSSRQQPKSERRRQRANGCRPIAQPSCRPGLAQPNCQQGESNHRGRVQFTKRF